jgi:hypothetical protein
MMTLSQKTVWRVLTKLKIEPSNCNPLLNPYPEKLEAVLVPAARPWMSGSACDIASHGMSFILKGTKGWHSAHTSNPSYWRGRDWEDHSSRSAQGKSSQDPILINKSWVHWHTPVISATQEA